MDRRVKERLIGASILVALFVLVVPELLSGPKPVTAAQPMLPAATPEPIRNVTLDLNTSKAAANTDSDAPAQAGASAASTASSAAPATAAAQNVVPQAATPQTAIPQNASPAVSGGATQVKPAVQRAATVESSAPAPTSSAHGSWSVQLGSFVSRANADNLTRQMKGQGFSAYVLTGGGSPSAVRYRVRVGPLPDRESAERMAAKLKALRHDSSLVAPAG